MLIAEEEGALALGLYVDPEDQADPGAIVEETSHLLCVAWHALQRRPVSRLILELQGEVDRYAVARLAGGDPFGHFSDFTWDDWMDDETRALYRTAHEVGLRYCRFLSRRFPDRADTPGLLEDLRRFYRASIDQKLHAGLS